MKSLLRTRVAGFSIEDAIKLSELEKRTDDSMVIPIDRVFDNLTRVGVTEEAQKLVVNGNKIPSVFTDLKDENISSDENYRLYDHEGIFIGVYSYIEETSEFKPVKIFME